jgi:hypothetical protein
VRRDHPLRVIREIANEALVALAADFSTLYSKLGRPSIASRIPASVSARSRASRRRRGHARITVCLPRQCEAGALARPAGQLRLARAPCGPLVVQ